MHLDPQVSWQKIRTKCLRICEKKDTPYTKSVASAVVAVSLIYETTK